LTYKNEIKKNKKKNKSLSQSTIICLMMNNECVYYIYIYI